MKQILYTILCSSLIMILWGCDDDFNGGNIIPVNNTLNFNSYPLFTQVYVTNTYGGQTNGVPLQILTVVANSNRATTQRQPSTTGRSITAGIQIYTSSSFFIPTGSYNVGDVVLPGFMPNVQSTYYFNTSQSDSTIEALYDKGTLLVNNFNGYYTLIGNFQSSEGDTLQLQYTGYFYQLTDSTTQTGGFDRAKHTHK